MSGQEHYNAAMNGLAALKDAVGRNSVEAADASAAIGLAQVHMLAYVGKALEDVALGLGVPPLRVAEVPQPADG